MAIRPVFICNNGQYFQHHLDFTWYSGFALVQKQKCVEELHSVFSSAYPNLRVLEVSTTSKESLGNSLSAFNLTEQNGFNVEAVFQGSKVFGEGGPYTDLYVKTGAQAKKDKRIKAGGELTSFRYIEEDFPLEPKTLFYNWVYINALVFNKELAKEVLSYQAFTDINFNPEKSINCQAEALSIYVALHEHKLLEEALSSKEKFSKIVYGI